jgi:hypothetical protein
MERRFTSLSFSSKPLEQNSTIEVLFIAFGTLDSSSRILKKKDKIEQLKFLSLNSVVL